MNPGTMVAFILNAQIKFGILAAIITRETKDGETKQFVVTSTGSDGTADGDVTIESEDDLVDMDAWNKGDRLFTLASRLPSYMWAHKKTNEVDAADELPVSAVVSPLIKPDPESAPL